MDRCWGMNRNLIHLIIGKLLQKVLNSHESWQKMCYTSIWGWACGVDYTRWAGWAGLGVCSGWTGYLSWGEMNYLWQDEAWVSTFSLARILQLISLLMTNYWNELYEEIKKQTILKGHILQRSCIKCRDSLWCGGERYTMNTVRNDSNKENYNILMESHNELWKYR